MRLNSVYALITLLTFLSVGFSAVPPPLATTDANITGYIFCANATTLNETWTHNHEGGGEDFQHISQNCAWGCVQGECLDGGDLAFNALITLIIYWGVSIVLFWLARRLDPEWELTITILNGAGIGLIVLGVLAVIMIYPPASGTMSAVIPALYFGITDSIPYVLIALAVMFVAIWIVRRLDYNRIRKGE